LRPTVLFYFLEQVNKTWAILITILSAHKLSHRILFSSLLHIICFHLFICRFLNFKHAIVRSFSLIHSKNAFSLFVMKILLNQCLQNLNTNADTTITLPSNNTTSSNPTKMSQPPLPKTMVLKGLRRHLRFLKQETAIFTYHHKSKSFPAAIIWYLLCELLYIKI
jgi:hypothetical protein